VRIVKILIVVTAAAGVVGCANADGDRLTSPSPLAVASLTAPSGCALPSTPRNLTADAEGSLISLSWTAVGDATDYVVMVGTTPTSADTLMTNTTDSRHAFAGIEPGTHFVRVHAHNWCGTSDATDPIAFTVAK
jgi:hypothetical protein